MLTFLFGRSPPEEHLLQLVIAKWTGAKVEEVVEVDDHEKVRREDGIDGGGQAKVVHHIAGEQVKEGGGRRRRRRR